MSNSKGEFGTDGVVNKDLPQGWTLYPLEEVVEIHNSLRKPINASERSKRDGIYPYYGATGQVGWIDDFRQDGEYVLLGEDGAPFLDITKDKAYIVSGKCWVNNHAHVLKGQKGKCLNKYLLHSLNQTDFRSLVNGTTRLKLTQASLRKIPINLAPLDVQESIVAKIEELFSELDSGVASLKTAQEQLKIYRQSLLKHAFEGKLTEQWRKDNASKLETPEQLLARIQTERETRYQQQLDEWKQAVKNWEAKGKEGKKPAKPALPKSSDLHANDAYQRIGGLPASWAWLKLSDLLQNSPQNGLYKPSSFYGLGCQIIRIDNFYDGRVTDKQSLKRLAVTDNEKDTYGLKLGDLIVNRVNSIEYLGKSALIRKLDEPIVFESNIMRCTLLSKTIEREFIVLYLNTIIGRKELCKNAKHAVNQASINQTDVGNSFLPICSLAEQQEIVNLLEEKLSIIEQNEKEIESALAKAELLRQSILKKAFSGQLYLGEEL